MHFFLLNSRFSTISKTFLFTSYKQVTAVAEAALAHLQQFYGVQGKKEPIETSPFQTWILNVQSQPKVGSYPCRSFHQCHAFPSTSNSFWLAELVIDQLSTLLSPNSSDGLDSHMHHCVLTDSTQGRAIVLLSAYDLFVRLIFVADPVSRPKQRAWPHRVSSGP